MVSTTHVCITTPQRNLRTFLHGDDFATVGSRPEVQWFKSALAKRFEIKTQCIAPGAIAGVGQRVAGTTTGLLPLLPKEKLFKRGRRVDFSIESCDAPPQDGRSRPISATPT